MYIARQKQINDFEITTEPFAKEAGGLFLSEDLLNFNLCVQNQLLIGLLMPQFFINLSNPTLP